MKNMKKILCIVFALALLLTFGCKKDDKIDPPDIPETPDTKVETPPAEQPQEKEQKQEPVINTWPDLQPDYIISEVSDDETTDDWTARFNSYREVGYFMEWQLGDGYTILEVLPGDADGEYLLWGMRVTEPGVREPFQMRVKVTPDGKDFSLLSKQELNVTEEWKAVQNYRALVYDLAGGFDLLTNLGYDVGRLVWEKGQPLSTDINYAAFQASMLTIMTEEMYDAYWADFFIEQDGKLAMHDVGGSGDRYLVEMVQPQEDGTYLSYEFIHDSFDTFSSFFVKVELEQLPNGTFRVAAWDPNNTAIMEQAQTAVPIGGTNP